MQNGINISLEGMLGGPTEHEEYLLDVVIPQIKKLHTEGKISDQQIKKIFDAVREKGIGVLTPNVQLLDYITLNTIQQGGFIAEASLQITDDVVIRNIIKQSATKSEFERGTKAQKKLVDILVGTQFEHAVPQQQYTNPKYRIAVTPLVHGETLRSMVSVAVRDEQIDLFKRVIDDYASLFHFLNAPDKKAGLNFPESFSEPGDYFMKKYGDTRDEQTHMLFTREFADDLAAGQKYVIHGDLHADNILINGEVVYLDWASASSNGMPEFDLRKLFRKTDVNLETEWDLARYAATKLFDTEQEQEESFVRYVKNSIMQDLLTTQRHLEYSGHAKSKEQKEHMNNIATVLYNEAIRRTRFAVEQGMVSEEFLGVLTTKGIYKIKTMMEDSIGTKLPVDTHDKLEVLTDEEYERRRQEYNPHVLTSIEAIQTITPVTEMVEKEEIDYFDAIAKKVKGRQKKRARRKGLWKIAFVTTAIAVMLTGIRAQDQFKSYTERIKREEQTKVFENFRNNIEIDNYRFAFSSSIERQKNNVIDGFVDNNFAVNSEYVKNMSKKYNFDYQLIRRIFKVNRLYGGLDSCGKTIETSEINVFDPLEASLQYRRKTYNNFGYVKKQAVDPRKNFENGLQRLRNLVDEKGSIKQALLAFYTASREERFSIFSGNTVSPKDLQELEDEIKKVAYTAMEGISIASDGGLWSRMLKTPPDNFFKTDS